MEKKQKREATKAALYLCFLAVMIITALFAFSGLTAAWFSTSQTVRAEGMTLRSGKGEEIQVTLTFYDMEQPPESGAVSGATYFGGTENTVAQPFSKFDTIESPEHYQLMKVSLQNKSSDADPDETYNASLTIDAGSSAILGVLTEAENNPISSILFFEFFQTVEKNGDQMYVTLGEGERKTLVNDTQTALTTVEFSSYDSTEFYVVFGYDVTLVNRLFGENIGNTVVENATAITFRNDLSFTVHSAAPREESTP